MSAPDSFEPSLWRRLVALVRLTLILAGTLVVAVSLALLRLVTFGALRRRIRSFFFSTWSRLMIGILGGRTEVHGTPPRAPFFLVSNHLSYLDILALAQVAPTVFVSKSEVASWPVIGWLTRLADTRYIRRAKKSDIPKTNAAIANTYARGDSVALFPEGTSSESDFVLPVRPPLLEVAASNRIPVSVAALFFETENGDPHAHRAICYYGDMVFASHVWRLLHLRGFTITIRFADDTVYAEDRKALALKVQRAIYSLQLENPPAAHVPRDIIAAADPGLVEP